MAELSNTRPPAKKPRLTTSSRSGPSDRPRSPISKLILEDFPPKHVEQSLKEDMSLPIVAAASGAVENSCAERGLLYPHSPAPSRLGRSSPPIYSSFKVIRAFPNGDFDVSADLPSSVVNDLKPVVKSPSLENACAINREKLLNGSAPPTASRLTSLSSSSSPFVAAIVIPPHNHLGVAQVDPATTISEVRACIIDEEKAIVRDSSPPPPVPPCSATPSPSFDVIHIFPGGDLEVLEATILPRSLNSSYAQTPVSAPSKQNSRDLELETVVLATLAWTFTFACGFGFLLLLAEWTHNACACSLMVVLSYNLGVHLVMKKCVKKRILVSSTRMPADVGMTRSRNLECPGFESHEDTHSGVVHVNGRFEVSSIRSSQDIFPSELLMNGQMFSSTPRKDVLCPGASVLTPMPSTTSLTVLGMVGTTPEVNLRTRRTLHVSSPSRLNIIRAATAKGHKTT